MMKKDPLYPLRVIHGRIHEFLIDKKAKYKTYWNIKKSVKEKRKSKKKFVFLVLTPQHGNLGDHAIALAEKNLLQTKEIDYIEITGYKLSRMKQWGLLNVMNGIPIVINGGGNLGTLWFGVEKLMRDVIIENPQSSIFIMPNTIFYENSEWGITEFEKSKKIYNKHKNLHLYARENTSYKVMSDAYINVKIIPDMVLSLNLHITTEKRKGCLLCLRGDIERTRSEQQDTIIHQQAEMLFGENISVTDTVVNHGIDPKVRDEELMKKFNQFANAELVITDRLHGMIFCAITGTPCIVINSKSPKVKGCYEWIKDLEYIKFVDDVSTIADTYNAIPKKEFKYDNPHLKAYYDVLISDLMNEMN